MEAYLQATDVIDWQHPEILALAAQLRAETTLETAQRTYEWVRDEVPPPARGHAVQRPPDDGGGQLLPAFLQQHVQQPILARRV